MFTKDNRILGFLRQNLHQCPQDVKEAAYKGLVRPILEYDIVSGTPREWSFRKKLKKFRIGQLALLRAITAYKLEV